MLKIGRPAEALLVLSFVGSPIGGYWSVNICNPHEEMCGPVHDHMAHAPEREPIPTNTLNQLFQGATSSVSSLPSVVWWTPPQL